ncbi:DUF596 domain-containing protein [Xenorhabdus sp. XENO-10]|uniref:DUF596 domain-containing protein n=1 Tax=Xenorhabdus yunnanensis TaxID=3025878 RepID=A0ABT5LHK6_9GAMM|nr:DUF596 domain-containing protein [Xenorhabdus yunnanensis]MDC9589349.1 DUF596 domain-containing protein [Xenorhabdus yunnanensis]
MLSEHEYKEIWTAAETRPLTAVWSYSEPENSDSLITFDERKKIFFWILERLLREGRIKLAKHGNFLEGSVDEQIEFFRQAFPKNEEGIEDSIWFFDESCPGEAVWVLEDGSLEWT